MEEIRVLNNKAFNLVDQYIYTCDDSDSVSSDETVDWSDWSQSPGSSTWTQSA